MGLGRSSKSESIKIARRVQVEEAATAQRDEIRGKKMAQRSYEIRELKKIITDNIKHQIENKEKQGYSREEIINGLLNPESKTYKEILETVIKRTNITVSLRDATASRAKKEGKDAMLINPRGNSLDAQIRRVFGDQILILKQKATENEEIKMKSNEPSQESDMDR